MTCAKFHTIAVLIGASGRAYVGSNLCNNPQPTCPRTPGEGYDKCKSICEQEGHAEARALAMAGEDAAGGSISVNHWYVCDACRALCEAAGVVNFTATGAQYGPPTPGAVKALEE